MARVQKPLSTLLNCPLSLCSQRLVWCLCKMCDCALPHPRPPRHASDLMRLSPPPFTAPLHALHVQ